MGWNATEVVTIILYNINFLLVRFLAIQSDKPHCDVRQMKQSQM